MLLRDAQQKLASLAGGLVGIFDVRIEFDSNPVDIARFGDFTQRGRKVDRSAAGDQMLMFAARRDVFAMIMPREAGHLADPFFGILADAIRMPHIEIQRHGTSN